MHTHRTAHIATYLWLTAGWNRLNSCSMSGGRRARLLPAHKQYVDGAYSSVCKARRKRLMTYVHRCKRIQWTRRYTSWNCMMLEKVMFSDESISCLFQAHKYLRRSSWEEFKFCWVFEHDGAEASSAWGCMAHSEVEHHRWSRQRDCRQPMRRHTLQRRPTW